MALGIVTAGAAGSNCGGGGSGGKANNVNDRAGGTGAAGRVIVSYEPLYVAQFISMETGSSTWCSGETRTVNVTVKNIGSATWTDAAPDVNIGLKWNTNGANWADYHVRTNAGNLAPGATATYNLTITASNNPGTGYTTPLANGVNNLTFDVVKEGDCWFGNNNGSCGPNNTAFSSPPITIISSVPAQPSIITGNASPCPGYSYNYSVTNLAGTTYTWSFPADWTITAGQGTNLVTVTVGSATGDATVTPSNACGPGPARTLAVITSSVPEQPSAITGNTTPCVGTSQAYSVTNVAGVTYNWAFPAGWTQTGGGTTNSVSVTIGAAAGNITVTPSNSCGNGTVRTLAVTTTTVPAQPSAITGSNNPCQGSTQTYSVTNEPGVTYTWTFPAGWTQTGGGTTNNITVTVGATSGTITVTPSNTCGNGTERTLPVTVQTLPVQTGPILPLTSSVCRNSVHNFTVNPPAPAGVTYTWACPGAVVQSGQGTNVVSILFGNTPGTFTLSITPSNACGNGSAQTMDITVISGSPVQPGPITGEPAPCIGSVKTYSVANIAGLIYTWSVPAGWSITAGQGTNSITATVGASAGNVSVTAGNVCGGSSPRNLAVTPQASVPAQPSTITGSSPVCQGSTQSYSVLSVPFVVYTWAVPAGWSVTGGQGTNTITVTTGNTTGTITVTPSNDCGTGTIQTRNIVVDVATPPATSAINGNNNPCQTSSQSYSVTNVTGIAYTWSAPADWTITAGQGTNAVTVTVGSISGNIIVVPSNGCGNGPSTSMPVNVFLLPSSAGIITGSVLFCEGTTQNYSVTPVAGVTYQWSVPAGWTINSGQGTNSIQTTTGVNSGSVLVTPQNACGNGPASTLSVTVNPLPAAETGSDGAICVGDDIQIGAPAVPGNTYLWTADPTGEIFNTNISNPVVRPDYTTTYTLTETNTSTGCSNSNSVTILANQVILLSVVPADQTICTGGNAHIVISSNISGTTFTYEAELFSGSGTTGFSNGSGPLIDQTITNVSGLPSVVHYAITATADQCVNDNLRASVTINPAPIINNQAPAAICSDAASGLILGASTNGVTITSYSILSINSNGLTASAGSPVTGTGFAANVIANDAWTNTTLNPVSVIYTVQGISPLNCPGNTFTVTLTINPEPVITNASAISICSGSSTNISLSSTIGTTFTWTTGTITGGITGASAGSGSTINQTLTNPSNNTPGTVAYIITPTSTTGGCRGENFTITVTVNPGPAVTNSPDLRICSGSNTNLTLTASTPSSFVWTVSAISGGITGATGGSGPAINQVLSNPSNATSGTVQYRVIATSTTGGCVSPAFIITVNVDPIPEVSAGAIPMAICPGEEFDLNSSSSLTWDPVPLLTSDFNSTPTGWSPTGTPTAGVWSVQNSGYGYDGQTFRSNDNSYFYFTRSRNLAATNTYLTSASLNTTGYKSLSLNFYHYFRSGGSSSGRVQVSTNGTSWTDIISYTSTVGDPGTFQNGNIDLSIYRNQPSLYIRFYYSGNGNRYWAIDNVTLSGTLLNDIPIISWTSNPLGFTSSEEDPSNITQSQTSTYTVTYSNPHSGCSADASVTVTNKPLPDAQITADYCSVLRDI